MEDHMRECAANASDLDEYVRMMSEYSAERMAVTSPPLSDYETNELINKLINELEYSLEDDYVAWPTYGMDYVATTDEDVGYETNPCSEIIFPSPSEKEEDPIEAYDRAMGIV